MFFCAYSEEDCDEGGDDGPLFEIPPPRYSAEHIIRILLDPTIPPTKVCIRRPIAISKSSTFIVDLTHLENPDDVKHDSFGSWDHSGSHPQVFLVDIEENGYITSAT